MRKITLIGLCLLAFTAVSFSRELEIVAHRGANHLAPENTFAAAQ